MKKISSSMAALKNPQYAIIIQAKYISALQVYYTVIFSLWEGIHSLDEQLNVQKTFI